MAIVYQANEKFTLGADGDLFLSVKVGNKQKANTLVLLNDDFKIWGVFSELNVGAVVGCKGKKLYIEVNATDTNSQTNTVPVSITLRDNASSKNFDYENDADVNGGTVLFEINIDLK